MLLTFKEYYYVKPFLWSMIVSLQLLRQTFLVVNDCQSATIYGNDELPFEKLFLITTYGNKRLIRMCIYNTVACILKTL